MLQPASQEGKSPKPRTAARLPENLDKRLLAYLAAAGAAGVGLMAGAQPAAAEVVYTPAHVTLGGAGNGEPNFYNLDLNHDGIADITLGSFVGATTQLTAHSLEVYPCYCKNPNAVVGTSIPFKQAAALRAGVQVGPGQQFLPNSAALIMAVEHVNKNISSQVLSTTFQGQWANGGRGVTDRYLGLKFLINGEVHYGWARITIGKTSALTGYAYETEPNVPIFTGVFLNPPKSAVGLSGDPAVYAAPASLGLLALGADGLPARRRDQPAAK